MLLEGFISSLFYFFDYFFLNIFFFFPFEVFAEYQPFRAQFISLHIPILKTSSEGREEAAAEI